MSQQSVPSALNKTDPTIEELGIGLIPPSRQTKNPPSYSLSGVPPISAFSAWSTARLLCRSGFPSFSQF